MFAAEDGEPPMTLRMAIHGAAGRMGKRLVALGVDEPGIAIHAAVEHVEHPQLGEDAGLVAGIRQLGLAISTELPAETQVVIDFSVPSAAIALIHDCVQQKIPLVEKQTLLHNQNPEDILLMPS